MRAVGKYPSLTHNVRLLATLYNAPSLRYSKWHWPRNFPFHQPIRPQTKPQTYRRHRQNKMLRS